MNETVLLAESIFVRVVNPYEVLWGGEVLSLASENSAGQFTILPDHARFMTILHNSPIVVELTDDSVKEFQFDEAVLYFHDNQANIYVRVDYESESVTRKPPE